MSDDTIKTVVENELCFGCGTCKAICPSEAIHIEFSPLGRLLPTVKEELCIHCGLCLKTCPGIDLAGDLSETIDASLMGHIENVLFAKSSDPSIFDNAQSGGGVTATLFYLIERERIDAAMLVHQVNHEAKYRIVTKKEDLFDCQSSQYTPVDLNSGLKNITTFQHVAVVGLPCHIEGIAKLKKAFPERFSNIEYLLGLVCAGTLGQACVEVTKKIGEPKIGKIAKDEKIYWRLKKYSNYNRAEIAIVGATGVPRILDNNIRHICKRYLTSPRCLLCFDKMNLYSDITFGDCWGVTGDDTKEGGNIIISRTKKGDELLSDLTSHGILVHRPCSTDEIKKGQKISKKKRTVEKVLAVYKKKSFRFPGWAESAVFTVDDSQDKHLATSISNFIMRDKLSPEVAVKSITSKVRTMLFIKKITGKIRKTIGYKKNA